MTLPTADCSRRQLLRGLFLGLGALGSGAASARWRPASTGASSTVPELTLPLGPLSQIGPVVAQPLTSGALPGVDDQVFAPEGFQVRCVARAGLNPLSGQPDPTGYQWHIDPDGGAVYPAPDGGWVYVSNSEDTPGGVGALRFDAAGTLVAAYPILSGTRNNCAGGATPWGTWLSCEETSNGEVWECDPFGGPETAVKKPALGAFPHEAAAIDPVHQVCYLTEDGGSQRFWRFVSAADDLSTQPDGSVRMGLSSGRLQVLNIEGFADGGYPDAAAVRGLCRASWVDVPALPAIPGLPQQPPTSTRLGTQFLGGEGIWYHEVPEALRQVPALGSLPTRGVIFFTTKGDNRVWAYDIENQLIELIFDNDNLQIDIGFDDVDNLVVSPFGDVLVAEDGNRMRLYVIVPNQPARLLMQITRGGSEICGPAFTPDGSRLYFSSQRGPSGADGSLAQGATYELTIPPRFRRPIGVLDRFPAPLRFESVLEAPLATWVVSETVRLRGFSGELPLSLSGGEYRLNGGDWRS
ncbi:MAG TPA: alkaline phosphatase PhoX, partial [Nevskiaceae bacterium]|nr:alkaline phosphatase PhoX [Nevskiaceae bacterium]